MTAMGHETEYPYSGTGTCGKFIPGHGRQSLLLFVKPGLYQGYALFPAHMLVYL
jgi:hypothetical protein